MSRRNFLLGLGGCALLSACRSVPPPPAEPITPEQALYLESRERMLKKFGRPGYELVVDAMKDQEFLGVEFFPEHAKYSFYRAGGQSLKTRSKSMQSSPPPERVRILWRDSSKFVPDGRAIYAGNIIGDELIEVGTRIPQELIDDLKRDPKGSLRLKFRMSDQGTLFGWDIQRILNPMGFSREEIRRRNILLSVEHFFAGGDFREAEIINGKAVRKGWYIDRRTGQKIETDF